MLLDSLTKNRISNYMPTNEIVGRLQSLFDLFSDGTRLKILSMLLVTSMCVTDISEMLSINQTTISHQLKTLRTAGLVTPKRQGKVVFYAVANSRIGDLLLSGVEYLGF